MSFPYLKSDAGATAECPNCRGSVLLPGHLQGVATKRKSRVNTRVGLALEISGFALMLWYPFGTIVGPALVFIGWRKNNSLRCSNCGQPTNTQATKCGKCRAAFSSD